MLNICKKTLAKRQNGSDIRRYKMPIPCLFNHAILLQFPERLSDRFRAAPSLLLQYIWTRKPGSQSGFLSISCLSYNKRSNWLTYASLGFYVRSKDC